MSRFGLILGPLLLISSATSSAALIGMSTDTDAVYTIDPITGSATFLSVSSGNYAGIGLSYLGHDLYATDLLVHIGEPWDVRLAKVDTNLGVSTSINQQDGSLNWHGLASNQSSKLLYTIDINDSFTLKSIDKNGNINSLGLTGIDGRGMAYDNTHGILYATDKATRGLYTVNTATGESDFIGNMGLDTAHLGLAYDELNNILFANVVQPDSQDGRIGSLFQVDVSNGATSLVGLNGVSFIDGLAWVADAKPIPAPPTLLLFGIGLLGMAGIKQGYKLS